MGRNGATAGNSETAGNTETTRDGETTGDSEAAGNAKAAGDSETAGNGETANGNATIGTRKTTDADANANAAAATTATTVHHPILNNLNNPKSVPAGADVLPVLLPVQSESECLRSHCQLRCYERLPKQG